jgi:hypothetical protein
VVSAGCIVIVVDDVAARSDFLHLARIRSPNRSRLLPATMQAFERTPGMWTVAVAPIVERLLSQAHTPLRIPAERT